MKLSNSKIKSLMRCEKEFYHRYVAKDIKYVPSEAMSCGALMDAIMTKNFTPGIDVVSPSILSGVLASTYSDGTEHTANLLLKSGKFSARASKTIKAALTLRGDPEVEKLYKGAEFQVKCEGDILGHPFTGVADIVTTYEGKPAIVDVKKTASDIEIWAETRFEDDSGEEVTRNRKMPWWDAYDYWMQLATYKRLLDMPDAITLLLGASDEEVPRLECIRLDTDFKDFIDVITPYIERYEELVADGWRNLVGCGTCLACRTTSKIVIPTTGIKPFIRFR